MGVCIAGVYIILIYDFVCSTFHKKLNDIWAVNYPTVTGRSAVGHRRSAEQIYFNTYVIIIKWGDGRYDMKIWKILGYQGWHYVTLRVSSSATRNCGSMLRI